MVGGIVSDAPNFRSQFQRRPGWQLVVGTRRPRMAQRAPAVQHFLVMNRSFLLLLLLWLTSVGLASETRPARGGHESKSRLPVVDAATAQAAGLKPAQIDEAANLYTAKCLRCHKSYDPRAYTDKQ